MYLILTGSLFLGVFSLFLRSSYGTIAPYRDSGDLISSSFTLGIAHPPGYCLYTILGKIFSIIIPFGNIAYRVQMFSALCSALNAVLVLIIVRELARANGIKNNITVFCGAAVMAVMGVMSKASWSLSQVAEMYNQQSFFVLLIIWLLIKFYFSPLQMKYLLCALLLFGLTAGIHPTVVLLVPAFLVILTKNFLLLKQTLKKEEYFRYGMISIGFLTLGLGVFIYFPLRSVANPVSDWGDPQTLSNFIRLVTRADYGILKLHPEESALISSFANLKAQIIFYLKNAFSQMNVIVFVFALTGLFLTRKNGIALFFAMLYICAGPLFSLMANLPPDEKTSYPILETNLVLPNLITAFLAGAAFVYISQIKHRWILIIASVAGVFACVCQVNAAYRQFDRRNNFYAYDYGKNVFKTLPEGGCIYDPDDSTAFICDYLQQADHMRLDVRIIAFFRTRWGAARLQRLYPEIMPSSLSDNAQGYLSEFFKKNIGITPLFADLPGKVPQEFGYVPKGCMYEFAAKKRSTAILKSLLDEYKNVWNYYCVRIPFQGITKPQDFFNEHILSYYMSGKNNLGIEYAALGDYDIAQTYYNEALAYNPFIYEVYNNLGIAAYYEKEYDKALFYFERGLDQKPNEPTLYYNMGLAYREKKDFTKACEYLLKNRTPASLNEVGFMFLSSGEYKTAEQCFLDALALDKNFALANYNLGVVYEKTRQYRLAENYYKMYDSLVSDAKEKEDIRRKLYQLRGM